MVATIFRKKATQGFKALNGMQRAILYDANIRASSGCPSDQLPTNTVHVEDWEEEGYGTTVAPLDEASTEVDDEVTDEEVGPGTVDEEFAEGYQAYAAAAETAAAAAAAAAARVATKRSAPDDDVDLRDLQLNQTWEKSFLDRTRNPNQPEDGQPAQEEEEDDPDLTSTALQDLLELTVDGIAVCWPPGIDARVARIILHRRRTMTTAKKQCDRAAPS